MNETNDAYSIAVIGGGSAAEALMRELAGSEHRIVVFEPKLLGGECPFHACMPSKAMLHDRSSGRGWAEAVERRQDIVSHLDDREHTEEARRLGVDIVRAPAEISGPGTVRAAGVTYTVDHVIISTGAADDVPDIDGLDTEHPRVWTSAEALTAIERPASVVLIGGGVIGSELAFMFAGFGIRATTLDIGERPAGDLHPRVSELIEQTLTTSGVDMLHGVEIERVELTDTDATVHLVDGSSHTAERVVVAVGRSPRLDGIGLACLGIDPDAVEIDDHGRVVSTGDHDVWILGDAAGQQQYTHVANHHAAVVADRLIGSGTRRYDDVVVPACIFIDPPVIVVGSPWAALRSDDDIVWAEIDLDTPRGTTDEHGDGFLAVAASRSTGCIVAANGIGARFDEIVHAIVTAIDGRVPVARLAQTIQPFPTVGEVLGQAYDDLRTQLGT